MDVRIQLKASDTSLLVLHGKSDWMTVVEELLTIYMNGTASDKFPFVERG